MPLPRRTLFTVGCSLRYLTGLQVEAKVGMFIIIVDILSFLYEMVNRYTTFWTWLFKFHNLLHKKPEGLIKTKTRWFQNQIDRITRTKRSISRIDASSCNQKSLLEKRKNLEHIVSTKVNVHRLAQKKETIDTRGTMFMVLRFRHAIKKRTKTYSRTWAKVLNIVPYRCTDQLSVRYVPSYTKLYRAYWHIVH